jgi:DNA-binding MarR family transcriptional regulator
LSRATKHLHAVTEKTFAVYGLNMAGFDVLSALRRSGPPYALSAGDLLASMMITSGTMTNRIDQLEKAGLVRRMADPGDARKAIVRLTPKGMKRIDQAIVDHAATQRQLLMGLTPEEVGQLDGLLRKLTQSLGV